MKRINAVHKSKAFLPIKYLKMFANAFTHLVDYLVDYKYTVRLHDLDHLWKKVAKLALKVEVPLRNSS